MQALVAPFEKTLGELLFQQQQLGEPIPVPLTLAILRQICDALDYAHNLRDANGNPTYMLHRDVSPGYILVGQQGAARLIASMALQANPSYVAPEILLGMVPDPRADLFSLGVVAHEMLTGRPLFLGANEHDTLARVCQLPIPPPSTINPAVTHDIEGIVLMALARDPSYRWQSAAMLRDGLAAVAARNGLEVGPESTAWAPLFAGQRPELMLPSVQFAQPAQPAQSAQPQAVPILATPIAAQPTVVAPPPGLTPLAALPTVVAPAPRPAPPLPAIPLVAIPAGPTAVPALPRPKSTTKLSNVASAKTPAPVIAKSLPSAPPRPHHNPAANKTPAPVITPTLPSPSANMFDDAPATMASAMAFDSRPPVDEAGPSTFDDSLASHAFDDAPATIAVARALHAPPANAFDDSPATIATKTPGRFENAFEDSPSTIATGQPASRPSLDATLLDLPSTKRSLAPPSTVEPTLPRQPSLPTRKPPTAEDLPAPRAARPSRQDLPPLAKPAADELPAPRAKQPSSQDLPRFTTPAEDLPAPRVRKPSSQDLPTFHKPAEDLPAPRANKPSQHPLPSIRKQPSTDDLPAPRASKPQHPLPSIRKQPSTDDLPAPRASKPPSQEVPNVRKEPGVDDLPAPRATRGVAAALFEDLPSPKSKATDEPSASRASKPNSLFDDLPAPRPKADPQNALFDDLPAPRPKADPENPLFADLPAPRGAKSAAPHSRALSNFDDDDAAGPPAPVGKKQPRASTADIDGFLASVANDQGEPAQTGDPEIDAYVASVVGDPAPNHPAPNYPAPNYPAPNYPAPNYPAPNYPAPNYPAPNYPAPKHPAPNYPAPNYPAPNHPAPNHPPPAYEQPADEPPPPAPEPAIYAQLPPPSAFELELGEFTNIGAAPLISFGKTGETPMVVGVGPKPAPPRAAAPTLPPPVAMIAANRVDEADDEPSSKKQLVMILLGALLVIGGAVVAFLLLTD